MMGREEKEENDVFFVCSVIEFMSRKTKNKRGDVVQKLGDKEIERLLRLADVLHSMPIEHTGDELISKYGIADGDFDNAASCIYTVPTHFDIAKVYKRLIVSVAAAQNMSFIDALIAVYTSWISEKIDNYNSSMYFENPEYIFESYKAGMPL